MDFFNEKYGNACVIGDMHTLRQRTMKKYPDVPYFILGHSMGSLLVRQYIQLYGNGLSRAVLLGVVSDQKKAVLLCGKRLCRLWAAFRAGISAAGSSTGWCSALITKNSNRREPGWTG